MRKLKNYKLTKFKAKDSYYDKEYADFAVATIMALDRAIRCGNDMSESVYDSRGLLFYKNAKKVLTLTLRNSL